MRDPDPLPAALGDAFSVAGALALGVGAARLRHRRLHVPFWGVRQVADAGGVALSDPYARVRTAHVDRALVYRSRLRDAQFFSHETAAALWGGPLPFAGPVDPATLPVHVSVLGADALPRAAGVIAHRARAQTTTVWRIRDLPVASPASTWASLGVFGLADLVALGDHLCRVWRPGIGRPDVGRRPLATVAQLRAAVAAGRRVGNPRLRAALDLIREDAWSPRETRLRLMLLDGGLPEPELNVDVVDDAGRFLGCVDLAYRRCKVAVEYHGRLHAETYARDVERMAALRAAGWIVIEVTSELLRAPDVVVARVRAALARL